MKQRKVYLALMLALAVALVALLVAGCPGLWVSGEGGGTIEVPGGETTQEEAQGDAPPDEDGALPKAQEAEEEVSR